MRERRQRISVGIVCVLLGFMITYQLKSVLKQNKAAEEERNVASITIQMEQLLKQKEGLEKKITELQTQIKNYEESAFNNDKLSKEIMEELKNTRMLTGSVDVKGEGVIITITPQSEIFGGASEGIPIMDSDLIKIVNELNAVDAEAISINDIRVTARSGIRTASNYIVINEERISPYRKITIKAIGSKNNLYEALNFPGVMDVGFDGCDIKYDPVDNVEIYKYDNNLNFEYARPIEEK